MESFQKRERDRRKILKRQEKAVRRKERSQSHAPRGDGAPPALPGVDPAPSEDPSAVRVVPAGPSGESATP